MYNERDFALMAEIICSHIQELQEIILFGSYARDSRNSESDVDIAVITEKKLARQEKLRVLGNIWNEFGLRGYDADIIIKANDEFELDKDIPVTISHTIATEGKVLWIRTA